MVKLGWTDSANLVTVRIFAATEMQLVGPIWLGLGHNIISV